MRLYRYFYYHYYRMFANWRSEDIPEWNALFALSIVLITNLIVISFLLNSTLLGSIFQPKVIGIFFSFIILVINYLLFIKDKKYEDIAKSYDKQQSIKQKKRGRILVILLTIEGFAIPFIYGFTGGFGLK